MIAKPLLFIVPLILLTPLLTQASGPVLHTGTPADDSSLPNTPASPQFGGILVNFESLPSCGTFPPSGCTNYSGTTFAGDVTFSSLDGLFVIPFSAQSAPNELFDNGAGDSANLTISLAGGTSAIGFGIADSDPVTISIQPLNSLGGDLGSAFSPITIPENTANPGNGYYYVTDTTPDIFGVQIVQAVSNANNSGLAIDDVQVAPEPSTFLLLITGGAAMMGSSRLRKRT